VSAVPGLLPGGLEHLEIAVGDVDLPAPLGVEVADVLLVVLPPSLELFHGSMVGARADGIAWEQDVSDRWLVLLVGALCAAEEGEHGVGGVGAAPGGGGGRRGRGLGAGIVRSTCTEASETGSGCGARSLDSVLWEMRRLVVVP